MIFLVRFWDSLWALFKWSEISFVCGSVEKFDFWCVTLVIEDCDHLFTFVEFNYTLEEDDGFVGVWRNAWLCLIVYAMVEIGCHFMFLQWSYGEEMLSVLFSNIFNITVHVLIKDLNYGYVCYSLTWRRFAVKFGLSGLSCGC